MLLALPVRGQRLLQTYESLYRGESAPRDFFDGYRIRMDLAVHPSRQMLSSNARALAFVLSAEYALSAQLSAGLLAEVLGGGQAPQAGLQWVFLKYTYHHERNDYALRVAVDPVNDGITGFPQVDVAFLLRASQAPFLVTDVAVGVRRVRMGFNRATEMEGGGLTRLLGNELTLLLRYNVLLSPSGSRVFLGTIMESGAYTRLLLPDDGVRRQERISSGAFRLTSGISLERPAYLLTPFLTLPLLSWGEGNAHTRVGIRLTVR